MDEFLTKSGKFFTKFPHIDQYRQIVSALKLHFQYVGKDENNEPIYDRYAKLPTIAFTGTVKIHGTNASVAEREGVRWTQSRNNLITPENDNAGFARFAEEKKESFDRLFRKIWNTWSELNRNLSGVRAIIYGEWFGNGVQGGVAVSQLPKKFAIFDVVFCFDDPEQKAIHLTKEQLRELFDHDNDIYNVYEFGEYNIFIDLENPEIAAEELTKLTYEVENECPVGKYFGVSGTGEGIVWSTMNFKCRFKTKGEKHSNSKVKSVRKLVTATPEEIENIRSFLEYAVTENRLEQGLREICPNGITPGDIKPFIRWVVDDTIREELDTIHTSHLNEKRLAPKIAEKARDYILDKINNRNKR